MGDGQNDSEEGSGNDSEPEAEVTTVETEPLLDGQHIELEDGSNSGTTTSEDGGDSE